MRECYGRTFRATRRRQEPRRSVKKGDLILKSVPFASVINNENRLKFCDFCVASSKDRVLRPCRKCRVPAYCSEDCERLAADQHQYECPYLKRLYPNVPPDFVRLTARIIFKLKNGGDKIVEQYSEKEGRRFRDLMNRVDIEGRRKTHKLTKRVFIETGKMRLQFHGQLMASSSRLNYADIKENEECTEDIDFVISHLKEYIGEFNLPNYSNFLGIYGRIVVNRFCLLSDSMVSVGSALYLAASILDHACVPNCSFYFSGRNVYIRALVDMDDFKFDKCRVSYVDPVQSTFTRREELHKKWFFWCDCKLCHDPERKARETTMKCEECQSPVHVPEWEDPRYPTTPTCTQCGSAVDPVVERRYKDLFNFTKKKLQDMATDSPDIEMCFELLKRQDELFHPMNVWKVRTMDFAFNAAVFSGCWGLVYDLGEKNHEGMRYYYGSEHPTFAVFLLKLGKAKMYLKVFREGLKHLEEAEPILRTAFSTLSPLLTEELIPLTHLANEDIEIALERRMRARKKKEEVLETDTLEKKLQQFLDLGPRSGMQRIRGSMS